MIVADYILAWSLIAVAVGFGARLLAGAGEERFARGLYAAGPRKTAV